MDKLTKEEYSNLGKALRDYSQFSAQALAGHLLKEYYPLSKEQTRIMLEPLDDEQLGRKWAQYCDGEL